MKTIEKLSDLTVTQLLIKAKLDDMENESIYLAELDSRQPSKQELNQATDNLSRITKSIDLSIRY